MIPDKGLQNNENYKRQRRISYHDERVNPPRRRLFVYIPKNTPIKYVKQNIMELKGKTIYKYTIIIFLILFLEGR